MQYLSLNCYNYLPLAHIDIIPDLPFLFVFWFFVSKTWILCKFYRGTTIVPGVNRPPSPLYNSGFILQTYFISYTYFVTYVVLFYFQLFDQSFGLSSAFQPFGIASSTSEMSILSYRRIIECEWLQTPHL